MADWRAHATGTLNMCYRWHQQPQPWSKLSCSPCLPQTVADKTAYALSKGLGVILCCGETLDERESYDTFNVIAKQVHIIVGARLGRSLVSVLSRAQCKTWPSRACQGRRNYCHRAWGGFQLKMKHPAADWYPSAVRNSQY